MKYYTNHSYVMCDLQRNAFWMFSSNAIHYITLHNTVQYYTILFYTSLYYSIVSYTIVHYTILYCTARTSVWLLMSHPKRSECSIIALFGKQNCWCIHFCNVTAVQDNNSIWYRYTGRNKRDQNKKEKRRRVWNLWERKKKRKQ